MARGVQGHTPKCPQDANMDPKGTQIEPKGAQMKPQGLPKVAKRRPTIPHVCQNGSPRSHNGAPGPPKVPTRHHMALQSTTKTKKTYTNRPRPGARRRRRRSGRGLEGRAHQAACRNPRSGAEAENRSSSNKGFVLILKQLGGASVADLPPDFSALLK